MIGGLVSWIGALLNTAQLESKTWFLVLLLLGIFSFGLVAMIAYVVAGPDGTGGRAPHAGAVTARDERPDRPSSRRADGRQDCADHRWYRRDRQGGGDPPRLAWAPGWASPAATAAGPKQPPPRSLSQSGNAAVDVFVADMSSQAEVRRLAAEVLAAYPRLDVLLNNVGGFWSHRHVTADGLEHTFALNHLAPFLLTSLLSDRLIASAPARVVTVSSGAQSMGKIDFEDLMGERKYSGQRAYNQSKLANVMFTYELARRFEGTGVTATALHPGMTNTAFSAEDPSRVFAPLVAVMRPFMASPERGADTPVYLASSPDAEGVTGQYFANRRGQEVQCGVLRRRDDGPALAGQRRSRRLPGTRRPAMTMEVSFGWNLS